MRKINGRDEQDLTRSSNEVAFRGGEKKSEDLMVGVGALYSFGEISWAFHFMIVQIILRMMHERQRERELKWYAYGMLIIGVRITHTLGYK